MVKARAMLGDGSPMLIFGLSDENMRRLPDEAMTFELGEICAGMTSEDLAQAKVMIMCGPEQRVGADGTGG